LRRRSLQLLDFLLEQGPLFFGHCNLAPQETEEFIEDAPADRNGKAVTDEGRDRTQTAVGPRPETRNGRGIDQPRAKDEREKEADPGAEAEVTADEFAKPSRSPSCGFAHALKKERLDDDDGDLMVNRPQEDEAGQRLDYIHTSSLV
jgi:hypothetical protein